MRVSFLSVVFVLNHLFCSVLALVHLSFFVILLGFMPPVFPAPLDGLTYYLATTFFSLLELRMRFDLLL